MANRFNPKFYRWPGPGPRRPLVLAIVGHLRSFISHCQADNTEIRGGCHLLILGGTETIARRLGAR